MLVLSLAEWAVRHSTPSPGSGARLRAPPRAFTSQKLLCHVRIPSRTASREHALIRLSGNVATIQDLSRHGTFVGKKKISEPVTLSDGDRIRIGAIEMVFRVRAAAEEDTPPPPPKRRRKAA